MSGGNSVLLAEVICKVTEVNGPKNLIHFGGIL